MASLVFWHPAQTTIAFVCCQDALASAPLQIKAHTLASYTSVGWQGTTDHLKDVWDVNDAILNIVVGGIVSKDLQGIRSNVAAVGLQGTIRHLRALSQGTAVGMNCGC